MSDLVIVDTSIFLNVLAVPGFDQNRELVLNEFGNLVRKGDMFFLPMATIWETGDHIADLDNGNRRREYAQKLLKQVEMAFEAKAPWRPTNFPNPAQFLAWLKDFPDAVVRQKNPRKMREGVSLSDLSIIKEWEILKDRHSMSRVWIWSIDGDLAGYDTNINR